MTKGTIWMLELVSLLCHANWNMFRMQAPKCLRWGIMNYKCNVTELPNLGIEEQYSRDHWSHLELRAPLHANLLLAIIQHVQISDWVYWQLQIVNRWNFQCWSLFLLLWYSDSLSHVYADCNQSLCSPIKSAETFLIFISSCPKTDWRCP